MDFVYCGMNSFAKIYCKIFNFSNTMSIDLEPVTGVNRCSSSMTVQGNYRYKESYQ
jgi:hypothetical protein